MKLAGLINALSQADNLHIAHDFSKVVAINICNK
jgi:hypothetical protein